MGRDETNKYLTMKLMQSHILELAEINLQFKEK